MRELLRRLFRRHVLTDFWYKLGALLLALVVWGILHVYLKQQQTFTVTVNVLHGSSHEIVQSEENQRTVMLVMEIMNGDGNDRDWGDPAEYGVYVQMPEKLTDERGKWFFTVNDLQFRSKPSGVRVTAMEPEKVFIQYDTIKEGMAQVARPKDLPLGATKLTFQDWYPKAVWLRGPSRYLNSLQTVSLNELPAQEWPKLKQAKRTSCELKVHNAYAPQVTIRPDTVTVSLREEVVVKDEVLTLDKRLSVLPSPAGLVAEESLPGIRVTLTGHPELIRRLSESPGDIICYVSSESLRRTGGKEVPVLVGGVPTELTFRLEPQRVTLRLLPPPADAPHDGDGAPLPDAE